MELVILNLFLCVVAVAMALTMGGIVERYSAWIICIMIGIGWGGRALTAKAGWGLDSVGMIEDIIGFIGFSFLAIYSYKTWPIICASCQLLAVTAHVTRVLDLEMRTIVYNWLTAGPTWVVILMLIAASLDHRERVKRSAEYIARRELEIAKEDDEAMLQGVVYLNGRG